MTYVGLGEDLEVCMEDAEGVTLSYHSAKRRTGRDGLQRRGHHLAVEEVVVA